MSHFFRNFSTSLSDLTQDIGSYMCTWNNVNAAHRFNQHFHIVFSNVTFFNFLSTLLYYIQIISLIDATTYCYHVLLFLTNSVSMHAVHHFSALFFFFLLSIFYSSSSQSVCAAFAKFLFPPAINIATTRPKIDGGEKEHGTRKEDLVV